ncbi:urea ABC transporter, permease protein UrtC [Thermodesulfatator indicus DSM 15286]|uniref:Urea ABC transporter, permease protein UrtC n=1 Tax=Thermodesulfatator indicus (strain DSM 15286 / JCM 11887 / CIR29812) TaxID=667014 RepID=F8A820_THEID|nr:urea ABC transporter permease subunit UrtC [Thermodesulfatator indicus]AEH45013.1 urea ABC transporter, permease protein UrtC [Thermodesulfatator indicus DSM 15286]
MGKSLVNKDLKSLVFYILFFGSLLFFFPFVLSDFRLNLLGKFLSFAIVAMGIALAWGYTGILSLGQGIFFGLGAYAMAMYLKLEASGPDLPDFMFWNGLTSLPWFWKPFKSAPFAFLMVIIVPLLLALIVGFVTFRRRISGVYFSLISQALTLVFFILFVGQQGYTGGTNGITDFSTIFGYQLFSKTTQHLIYYITVFVLFLLFLFGSWLVKSQFGKILVAIRDKEDRIRFSGYNPDNFKMLIFAISAVYAGIAGALFVLQEGLISPSIFGVVPSIEMVIWAAIGGRTSLLGAAIGALLVNTAKTFLSENFPEIWLYFLGILFIIVVRFLPEGLVSLFNRKSSFSNLINKIKLSLGAKYVRTS